MKESKNKFDKIRIYINTSKPYYYPGEKLPASILIDVFDKVKCDKMQVIAKGKIMIKDINNLLIFLKKPIKSLVSYDLSLLFIKIFY